MTWMLQVLVGDKVTRRLILDVEEVIIGRSPACTVHLPHMAISRHHARILTSPHTVIAEDLDSTNGIFVGGERVQRVNLESGDSFSINPYAFRVEKLEEEPENITRASTLSTGKEQSGMNTAFIDIELIKKLQARERDSEDDLEQTHLGTRDKTKE